MKRFKIIFNDNGYEKKVYGRVDPDANTPLLKVFSDDGNLIYINRENIVFMRELDRGNYYKS